MADVTYVPKACAYVTRRDGRQLLVFRGPELDRLQIPKGTLEPDEPPAEGLQRELHEETGLTARRVRRVATDLWTRRPGRRYVRQFFHVTVGDAPDRWRHRVTGDGPEAGAVFRCRWVDRPLDRPLALDLDDHLSRLPDPPAGRSEPTARTDGATRETGEPPATHPGERDVTPTRAASTESAGRPDETDESTGERAGDASTRL